MREILLSSPVVVTLASALILDYFLYILRGPPPAPRTGGGFFAKISFIGQLGGGTSDGLASRTL